MQHFRLLEDVYLQDVWLTIGSFDGVHVGHQEIVRSLIRGARAAGAPAVVLTFDPHPAVVLGKRQNPFYLTTPEERAALLGKLGVDVVITHPFNTRVAELTAHDFIARLFAHLGFHHLCVGYNFALGRNREGDVQALQRLGAQLGYTMHIVDPIKIGNRIVSSSQIREALRVGDVVQAANLLGRTFQVSGEVIKGDARGRALGIPTANLAVWAERALPKSGVYVCQARLSGELWGAVTNVGVRPIEHSPVSLVVEAHILDFEGDLYGQLMQLEFLTRLRDERRFPDVSSLVAQIEQDLERARQVLQSEKLSH
ncbi:MAG TPA: bifunctional riboflavin kinase/FAD synthetase [bacterium]|nr:bifunctional riboflavin kinase/FAD synthetase [bacterium]